MRAKLVLWLMLLSGCAGLERDVASGCASNVGADWVIVQFDAYGKPFGCWALKDTSVSNEPASDGIYWLSPDGHLVHISGFYNRVQVARGRWNSAFRELGISSDECGALRRVKVSVGETAAACDDNAQVAPAYEWMGDELRAIIAEHGGNGGERV